MKVKRQAKWVELSSLFDTIMLWGTNYDLVIIIITNSKYQNY